MMHLETWCFVSTICAVCFYCILFLLTLLGYMVHLKEQTLIIFYMIYFTASLISAAEGHKMIVLLFPVK